MSLIHKIWNEPLWLSFSAGILATLSFPPFPFPPLLIISFVLFFRLMDISASSTSFRFWIYISVLIWNIGTTYWLSMATVAGGIAAMVANSLVMIIPFLIIRRIKNLELPSWFVAVSMSSIWVLMEWLHFRWDLAWPWLTLGNAFSTWTWAVQYISVTGTLGISFWMVLSSFLFYKSVSTRKNFKPVAIIFVAPIIISLVMLPFVQEESDQTISVGIVQPNFDSYQQNSGFGSPKEVMNRLIGISDSLIRQEKVQLILWPENALTGVQRDNSATMASRMTEIFSKNNDVHVLGGSSLLSVYNTETDFPTRISAAETSYDIFNSALLFSPNDSIRSYKKFNLVPLVERLPFAGALLPLITHFLPANSVLGFGKGDQLASLTVDDISFTPAICYDSVFGEFIARSVRNGSQFIAIITNDGWWGNSSGHSQHFEYARLRAVENRRWIARSANNGISAYISPNGSVHQKTEYWTTQIMAREVPLLSEMTIYARFGDWIVYPILVNIVLLIGWKIWRRK